MKRKWDPILSRTYCIEKITVDLNYMVVYIWQKLTIFVDAERHQQVAMHLHIQEQEARWWRDACLLYFQTFSKQPIPAELEPPVHNLEYYQSLSYPYAPGIRPRW